MKKSESLVSVALSINTISELNQSSAAPSGRGELVKGRILYLILLASLAIWGWHIARPTEPTCSDSRTETSWPANNGVCTEWDNPARMGK